MGKSNELSGAGIKYMNRLVINPGITKLKKYQAIARVSLEKTIFGGQF